MSDLAAPGLLAAQRRNELLAMLAGQGKIDVSFASKALRTSHETIRKDLVALESQGLLKRVHGGALPIHTVTFEEGVDERTQHLEEKRRIANRALQEVPSSGAIFIDSGSTTRLFAELLPGSPNLVVFTNSLPIAQILLAKPAIPCFIVGGRVRGLSQATVGPWAQAALGEIRVDVAFVGTNALSLGRGLSTPDAEEAATKALMIKQAGKAVLMVDHSKFGQDAMFAYSSLDQVDMIITGEETKITERQAYRDLGVEVQVA